MKRSVLVLAVLVALAVPAARAAGLYGVLDCTDQVTVIDSVFLKQLGRQEVPVYTSGFRGDPGEVDTFDFGNQRWPDEYVKVKYLYNLTRMPPVTFSSPQQNTWYSLPAPSPVMAESRVKFYLGDGIFEEAGPGAAPMPLAVSPNPVAGRATVRFSLPAPARVRAALYDRSGRAVRTLCAADLPAGETVLDWDRRDSDGNPVGGGVYVLRVTAGEVASGLKLVVRD